MVLEFKLSNGSRREMSLELGDFPNLKRLEFKFCEQITLLSLGSLLDCGTYLEFKCTSFPSTLEVQSNALVYFLIFIKHLKCGTLKKSSIIEGLFKECQKLRTAILDAPIAQLSIDSKYLSPTLEHISLSSVKLI